MTRSKVDGMSYGEAAAERRRRVEVSSLIMNVKEVRAHAGKFIRDRPRDEVEGPPVDPDRLIEVWKDRALFHDPARHVVTRNDGTHILGKSDAETVSCFVCNTMVANEEPWAPPKALAPKTGRMCSECWTGPIPNRGTHLTPEQEAENDAALAEWEATLTPQQMERRRMNADSLRVSREVATVRKGVQ